MIILGVTLGIAGNKKNQQKTCDVLTKPCHCNLLDETETVDGLATPTEIRSHHARGFERIDLDQLV